MRQLYSKEKLFHKLQKKGIFWQYSKTLKITDLPDKLFCETVLKYGDFSDIQQLFKLFSKDAIEQYWRQTLVSDKRFTRLNVMLGRVFFHLDVNGSYFLNQENSRYEKLKRLAS
ncbi:MAG: hypothetical protein A3F18_06710 [Legionellales bacterium RIFCSPHIGHO2_12_FULL_37_14]|nr:MAG: hypothetical protein A3F18_06710 [Legionellales bacterium RIFCSPHIGHO2_12_FULL_37_14]